MGDQKKFRIRAEQEEEMGIELNDAPEPAPSYAREISGQQLESYIDDIADTVRVGLDQSISILTPWFFNNMPKIYYQTTPRQEKVRHLSAIITGHVFETKQTVELWDRDKSKVTYIGPGGDRKILSDMAKRISNNNLKMGAVYFSRDNLLFLSTFFCTDHKGLDQDNKRILEKVSAAKELMLQEYPDCGSEIETYVKNLDNDFVMYATAARLSITFRMVKHMLDHQGAHTFIDTFENSPNARLTLGLKNVNPAQMMEPILTLIHRYDFNVGRAFVAKFEEGYDESITVMHFIMSHGSSQKVSSRFVPMIRLNKALRTMGWVDYDEFADFTAMPYDFSINATNLIRSFATYAHLFLSKRNPYAYSLYKIRNTFAQNHELLDMLVKFFRAKFDPSLPEGEWERTAEERVAEIKKEIDGLFEDIDRHIFKKCLKFIKYCLKTNYFLPTKTGLAFRLDPAILDTRYYPHAPYGIFFILGKDFRFFQVRWKDIARGGMRVVMPRSAADYDMALAGLFDEVYGLSHAQQMKNKDIPEGGSKAVLVLKPDGHRDQAVKGSVNALLDLLVEEDESHENLDKLVSYYDKTEIIYLGPDENMTNELINWIPAQAKRRGYKYAPAFMSSKPGEGINHKEYGVTSEGVNVFVENTLQFLGIDPRKDSFKVKMTGGPDGDVAGNELMILHREYKENARVVSISDGFGAAYDPEGLDWAELLRLVKESKSIVEFDKGKLSKSDDAFVIAADSNENIKTRNEIYRRVYADIFIPAGGRPYSVNGKNWSQFFTESGESTVRAIVEGANIFFTDDAREKLQENGVFIIKDSSANKTGVICSSYEIIASLVISAQEFLAIKEDYVQQVIDVLRQRADAEAKLLFRVYAEEDRSKTLVELSLQISKEINRITDVLLENLTKDIKGVLQDPLYQAIVIDHCPPILVEKYRDRILERLPDTHQIAIIASSIASYVVYNEGLTWLKSIPSQYWFEALKIYIEKDRLTHQLLENVKGSSLAEKGQIEAILSMSAARNLTVMELQSRSILK
ncbi:NAD-glutamate dehydrogenase domain-containing protein [Pseudobacteriovorax antillogorgiicola]|uniref:Glutamate dehydrogenase (NAD) n=1 Tax=Pseudobacteriovorax antillogorgiicola TaxID=1513793 RepID=A0A1Y6C8C4_9BACT|nr:NAD-glutamate dehydrogenase domain-containing protein [Pseudobacteriovorax antillogorgiicola]TCS50639.1 glutamate dehydrogenase (NAD) [Pseudobacteriovorax antillogorgiicola]SMF39578.1 glutamate dehydrogenase (NAD) [Pseudobacteriovorax antillogorgiicola]